MYCVTYGLFASSQLRERERATQSFLIFSDEVFLTAMFEDNPAKYCALTCSILSVLVTTPFLYIICSFEKSNHYRTLINQLVSSLIWIAIGWNLLVQIPIIVRYILGPFTPIICYIDTIVRNAINMQIFFYLNSIILVRYIFIFHLKNPTALQGQILQNLFPVILL